MLTVVTLQAQRKITGRVIDQQTREAMPMVTVKLLKADSTMVKGALTNESGQFTLEAPADGRFIVQITNVGYVDATQRVQIRDGQDRPLGDIAIKADAIMLAETTVTAQAAKVTLKADTFVYNASAFRTPEGSTIEELVKRLPGATVSDDGKITINGKEVKKIMIDGREFMTGDTQTALKNLPTSIVERVKAYDRRSDLSRISGIDDGNEETVLDFGVKPGMNRGTFSNLNLGAGTEHRYSNRLMGARFNDQLKVMLFANANNTNDRGFPGGGGGFGGGFGRQGLASSKMIGVNINYEPSKTFKWDGSLRWNHNDGDVYTRQATQNFFTSGASFSNSLNQNYTRANRWNGQMRLEWQADSLTNIMFRPTFSFSTNDTQSSGTSAAFSVDPYLYVDDPLSAAGLAALLGVSDTAVVNTRRNVSINYTRSTSFGGQLQLNRRLNAMGRNVTLILGANYGENKGRAFQTNNVHLYQVLNALGNDSTYQTNRYNLTPTKSYNYSVKLTYSEPIARATYLQFSYEYQYKYQKSDRSTYDFSLEDYDFSTIDPAYRGWDRYLEHLSQPLDDYLSVPLSRYSEYRNYIHTAEVMLRVVRKAYNFNVGLQFIPQRSKFVQRYQGVETDTVRTVFNFTPTADFRWKISDVSQLRFNYRGQTSQPSMSDLLDITDNSDPLNITTGNPGLKPAFTNTFRLMYNNYIQDHQRAIMAHVNLRTTSNSISQMVTYDAVTGGRFSRPENINGNWNASGFFVFNTAIDSAAYFNVNTSTELSYAHNVGYTNLNRSTTATKSITKLFTIGERLAASYRNEWLEFEPNGSFQYSHSRNSVQTTADLDTWTFSYGFNANLQLPWGMALATDMNMNSRRGFSDSSMNTNELIWNAQLSQSFLRGNALTVSLQVFDILHQQSTITRTINEMMRSDTEYNAITQYVMLRVSYRLNLFGSRDARQQMRRGGGPGGPGGPGGLGGPGGRRGGGGFGGPRRF